MHCLKCGTEVRDPAVFCEACLKDMEKHPVPRETPVVIPTRPQSRERRKRPAKPEELLAQTRKWLRRTFFTCIILALLCAILTAILIFVGENRTRPIGQNYITSVSEAGSQP